MRALALAFAVALVAMPAMAQTQTPRPRPPLTGNVEQDIDNLRQEIQGIKNSLTPATAVSLGSQTSGGTVNCDFNLFNALKPETLINQLKTCSTDTFVEDTSEALASATASKDQVGTTCLTPALAILKAAQAAFGQAPQAATSTTTPATSTPTAPDTSTAPAAGTTTTSPNGPTFKLRLILLFQKWREFGIAGGPSACKSWVQTTVTMTNPLLQ